MPQSLGNPQLIHSLDVEAGIFTPFSQLKTIEVLVAS